MLSLAVIVPLAAIGFLMRPGAGRTADGRTTAAAALSVSLLLSLASAWMVLSGGAAHDAFFELDALASVPMPLFTALALITAVTLPRRDCDARSMAGLLAITAGTLAAYASPSLPLFCAAWAITAVPFVAGWFPEGNGAPGRTAALASVGLLAAACVAGGSWPGFVLLALAALLRKGIFPFHFWIANAFEEGSAPLLTLFLNGHLGALALARFGLSLFPPESREALGLISTLALLTAIYTAVLAIAQKSTPRVLALISVSQASFILAGLESRNHEGIAGATIHWMVVAAATTGLSLAYRLAQTRHPKAVRPDTYLGLAARAPRLAVFFAVCGLALAGLPGTLGFVAEDLLFHGAIESQPLLGLALPLATALNAITIVRLFTRLFLGRPASAVPEAPDVRPAERWALSACAVFLVAGGLWPAAAVALRHSAAEGIATLLALSSAAH